MYGEVNCCEPVSDMKTCGPVTPRQTMKDELTEVLNVANSNLDIACKMHGFLFAEGGACERNKTDISCMADQVIAIKQYVYETQEVLIKIMEKMGL